MIRSVNVLLRAAAMILKFIIVLFIAKYFSTEELGRYSLISAGVMFFVLVVGGDYYTYSNRELMSSSKELWPEILKNQAYSYGPLYLILLPVATVPFIVGFIDSRYLLFFLAILVLEHFSTELNRLLNAMQLQLKASLILFLRVGVWVLPAICILWLMPESRELEYILMFWISGCLLSLLVGIYFVAKHVPDIKFNKPNYSWIMKGYKVGFTYLSGSLILKALTTLDRFWLQSLSGEYAVGIYAFFFSIILGVSTFFHAAVTVFSSPKIVRSYSQKNMSAYKANMKVFGFLMIAFSISVIVLLLVFMPHLLGWIGKLEYKEYYPIFYICLGSGVLLIFSNYPHTYLYAAQHDRMILLSHVISIVIFFSVMLAMSDFIGIYRVSLSVLASILALTVSKLLLFITLSRVDRNFQEAEL
ncbi:lipopolysaccharide biosynthesis protein [Saccharospirillum salsuginis]|uniref:lipopolysaccharide biosynthesis protein n=1 Tax=Saccharospirillum salsuginis TaxID=418750 RepID=UPI001671A257|nr:oligosaccharide flippase family protein [Saccharospirillum salsuginis]